AEEHDREPEHQRRPDEPVLDQTQPEYTPVAEHRPKLRVVGLRQRRVHHQYKTDLHEVEVLDRFGHRGSEIAEPDANRHRAEDPDGEILVEEIHRARIAAALTLAV